MGIGRIAAAMAGLAWCAMASAVAQSTYYVATNGAHVAPFDTWVKAATNVHAAVALATDDDTVWVSNGVYRLTNQLAVAVGMTLRSVNGAADTMLEAEGASGGFRVVDITHSNASVAGFTLTNGYHATAGAGVYMTGGVVADCVIVGCSAPASDGYGGGVWMSSGLLTGTVIRACQARNGGGLYASGGTIVDGAIEDCVTSYVYSSRIFNDTVMRRCRIVGNYSAFHGGGISVDNAAVIDGCLVASNTLASSQNTYNGAGGGIRLDGGRAVNCLVIDNSGGYGAGIGILAGSVVNCTVAGNASQKEGGGVYRQSGVLTNTIVYGNSRLGIVDNYYGALSAASFSCAPELTNSANGNVAADPVFAGASDHRLQLISPGIDSGTNVASVTTDIDLAPRPQAGNGFGSLRHDMGAYEANGSNGALRVGLVGAPLQGLDSVDCELTAVTAGANTDIAWYGWGFTNGGTFDLSGPGLGVVTNSYGPGRHTVRLLVTNSVGESATTVRTNLIVVSSTNIYVSPAGQSTFPYSSWEYAATNVHDAVAAALGGCTILVSNGAYRLTNEVFLAVPATLRSVNGATVTALYRDAAFTNRLIHLNHADALAEGFTLSNGLTTAYGGGVYLRAGTVRDCVVTNCRSSGGGLTGGGGIRMESGLVTNTLIVGCQAVALSGDPPGGGVWMSGGTLADCTIQACQARSSAGIYATGGLVEDAVIRDNVSPYVYANTAAGATFRRCRIFNNSCAYDGGGIRVLTGALLENCLVYSNRATTRTGGGIFLAGGAVDHCTVANNDVTTSSTGGGIYQTGGAVRNTIIFGNTRGVSNNNFVAIGGTIAYSCAPELSPDANGNIKSDPQFRDPATADYHLQFDSPCIDAGTNLASVTTDIERTVRPLDGDGYGGATSDMGAYEAPDATTGPLRVTFSATPLVGMNSLDAVFTVRPAGADTNVVWYGWDFDSDGGFDRVGPDLGVVTQNFTVGRYTVTLLTSNATERAGATNVDYIAVSLPDLYVATNGAGSFPYGSWPTAATSIHDAVDAALSGSTIHLSNGTHLARYRVDLSEAIVLRGEGGATNTMLARDAAYGSFGVLLVSHADAVVEGLTIADGLSTTLGGGVYLVAGTVRDCVVTNCEATGGDGSGGGGIRMESGAISNTVFVNCRATGSGCSGAGVWMTGGRLADSVIRNCLANTAGGFMATGGIIEDCMIRDNVTGYIYGCYAKDTVIRRCQFVNNTVGYWGGGVRMEGATLLENCLVDSNRVTATVPITSARGGGVHMYGGRVVNCTVVGNSATGDGGGIYCDGSGVVTNGIVYFNTVAGVPDDCSGNLAAIVYTCAPELPHGVQGNITNAPRFDDAGTHDYHIAPGSPCLNAGINQAWMETATDLDGNDRIIQGIVDMGAYEWPQPAGTMILFR